MKFITVNLYLTILNLTLNKASERNILPENLVEMFAKEQCNIPWYEILKAFEETQKEYEKTRPSTESHGNN